MSQKISARTLIADIDITGDEKIPIGVAGDLAITPNQIIALVSVANGPFRGAHDASGGGYPLAGTGSGTAGAIQGGDEWYVSVQGDIDVYGIGVITVYPRTLIKAIANGATTPAEFIVIQQ